MEKACEVRLVDFGSLKALVSVRFGDMEIRGFKVIDSGDGKAWVASPSREIHKDGKKEYYNIVRFTENEAKNAFSKWVLKAYFHEKNGNGHRLD
ncbi:MAG: septation protein SpoVG family protein [Planctomycetota bacterium]|jgi:DNA-binding cell septation regulator SpoVG